MDDLERMIARHLRATAETAAVPPGLSERVHARVRRRRRRRRLTEITGIVTAVAVVAGVPAAVHLRARLTAPPRLTASAVGPPGLGLPLDHLASVPRRLPGGTLFTALALGPDGTLVGQGMGYDGMDRPDGKVWRSTPGGGPPRLLAVMGGPASERSGSAASPRFPAVAAGLWAADTDGRHVVWPQATGARHDFELMCSDPASDPDSDPRPRQLGDRGVAETEYAVAADNGIVVWNDEAGDDAHTVWAARSCDESPRPVFRGGSVVAFTYPDVLVVEEDDRGRFTGRLTEVNVDSGAATPLRLPPEAGPIGREGAPFAANRRMLVWADGRTLTVLDRRTGRTTRLPVHLPHSIGLNGETVTLTAGNRVLVYSTRPVDGDPAAARSLVYDLRTARASVLAGDALAAGDWVVWRDGERYRLGRIR